MAPDAGDPDPPDDQDADDDSDAEPADDTADAAAPPLPAPDDFAAGEGYAFGTVTVARPHGPYLGVAADITTVGEALYSVSFQPAWDASGLFRGENLNMARRSASPPPEHSEIEWWRTHVRGWQRPDGGCWLRAHYEPSARDHPMAHAQEVGYDVPTGMRALMDALAAAGLPHSEYHDHLPDEQF